MPKLLTGRQRGARIVYVNMNREHNDALSNSPGPQYAALTVTQLGAGVIKRATHMADGREIIYYDDPDTVLPPERLADTRHMDARPPTAQMRQDVLTGEWVSIAAARQKRVFLPPAEHDPLAPASPSNPSEIPSRYDVVVFENKSPSFGPAVADEGADPQALLHDTQIIGQNRSFPSVGRCEVVCFSPDTVGSFASQSVTRARTIVETWADRVAALSAVPGVQQVFPFENRGEAIGVTLHHPHGQIYSYPYITPKTAALLRSIEAYGPTLFHDILEREQRSERVLLRGEYFTAFVPFAARWPIEIHMLPHRHVPDFAGLTAAERDELAVLYRRLLRAVDALYSTPTPYISAWHQAPVRVGRDTIRLMLQITSPRRAENRLKYLAGSESAMGAFIGDIPPEVQAAKLRTALASVTDD
jgi:UDPglucose--hexose-1-phosphate uridylyltransferase